MDKLLPCPFCGGADLKIDCQLNNFNKKAFGTIKCCGCGIKFVAKAVPSWESEGGGIPFAKDQAIEAWNTRHTVEVPVKKYNEMRDLAETINSQVYQTREAHVLALLVLGIQAHTRGK